jgi:hypothetical protein
MLTCPSTPRRGLQLCRANNNDCRQIYQPQPLNGNLPPEQERRIMEQNGTPWGATKGWESHMTDKHGRRTTITTGPPGQIYINGNKLTAWAHNIIQHCRLHIPYEQHGIYMTSIQAETSLDPHLLQGLADAVTATTIHDTHLFQHLLSPMTPRPWATPLQLSMQLGIT